MNIQIEIFKADSGKEPYTEWADKLDMGTQLILDKRLLRVRKGLLGDCKPLVGGDGVWELVIDYGPGYRIYFGKKGNKIIVLLIGGSKKSQDRDIAKAKEYWKIEQEKTHGKK